MIAAWPGPQQRVICSMKILDVFTPSVSLPSTAHAGNADMIQPGLIPLQPNLDFMDSFDPLQGSRKAPPIAAVVLHTH